MVPRAGGEPRTICEANGPRRPPGTASTSSSFVAIAVAPAVSGACPRRADAVSAVTTPDRTIGETGHLLPMFLPDGRHFLYASTATDGGSVYIWVAGLESNGSGCSDLRTSTERRAWPSASRVLFYVNDGTLLAQPLDVARLGSPGEPGRVAEDIQNKSSGRWRRRVLGVGQWRARIWTSRRGSRSRLAWFTRDGRETRNRAPLSHYGRLSLALTIVASPSRDAIRRPPGLALLDLAGARPRVDVRPILDLSHLVA